MPTYQYACTDCGDRSEVVQRFTDDPLTVCSACGGKLRKVFSAVGIVFDMLGPCEILVRPATLEVIARLIDGRVATFLSVSGLPGWATGRVLLNPSLETAVRDRDGDTMQARLVDAFLLSALHPQVAIAL